GFVIQSVPVLADFDDVVPRHQTLVAAETAQVHAAWFAQYPDLYHDKTSDLIRRGQTVSAEALATALAGRETLRRQLSAVMAKERIDLWLSPSAVGSAPPGLDSTGDPVLNLPWTHAGLPTMTLPAGFNESGLPLGLQLAGRWYGDEALVAAALLLESGLQNI
ncbi:MAG: amidase family protein, partial [Chloroflexota bacterium]